MFPSPSSPGSTILSYMDLMTITWGSKGRVIMGAWLYCLNQFRADQLQVLTMLISVVTSRYGQELSWKLLALEQCWGETMETGIREREKFLCLSENWWKSFVMGKKFLLDVIMSSFVPRQPCCFSKVLSLPLSYKKKKNKAKEKKKNLLFLSLTAQGSLGCF